MKIISPRIYSLFLITFSIACFQLNTSASLNPGKRFLNKESSSKTIKINNNYAEVPEGLVEKLSKQKAKENTSGQQKIYKKILTDYYSASIAKEAAYNRGLYLFNIGKWEEAFDAFSVLKKYHPDFTELDSAIKLQFRCAENLMNEEQKKIFGLKSSTVYNAKSIPLFLKYKKLFPYDKNAPLALLYAAKASKDDKEYESAIFALKDLINTYPDSQYSAEAYFLLAHMYSEFIKGPEYDLESTREAVRYCEDFVALYPGHEEIGAIEALHKKLLNTLSANRVLLSDYYYFNKQNNVAAIIFYNEAITIAPDSQAAIEAKERLEAITKGIRPTTGRNFIKKLLFIK